MISHSLILCELFRSAANCYDVELFAPRSKTKLVTPLVVCPLLHIQYFNSYLPYLVAILLRNM